MGAATFNVLDVLATGGLWVSGIDTARGPLYPPLGPPVCRNAAEGHPPWALCPPREPSHAPAEVPCQPPWGSTTAPGLPRPPPPTPDEGAGAHTTPPKDIEPNGRCSPPPPRTGTHH